ncbi:MAG: Hsp20/alpha crystallin family protein [Proteobacteria bacterium]|nr:Hsp20/alpha crystallin family protein [Pseudomonadota bacterium]
MADTIHKLPIKNKSSTPAEGGWRPLQSLRHEVDRLFDTFDNISLRSPFSGSAFNFAPFGQTMAPLHAPAVDIAEKDKEYEITAELPGIDEKDIEVSLANGGLVIRGHEEEQKEERKKDYFLSERQYGTFERYFGIPEGIDTDRIAASFKNGVLTVTLPKSAGMQASEKKIAVKAA